jgi:hypothetical protein
MTEHEAQNLLHRYASIRQHECIVPNVFAAYSWESDVLSITRAGYVHEYEIKVSLADFKKDAGKTEKHEILKTGSRPTSDCEQRFIDKSIPIKWCNYDPATNRVIGNRPNYFWYACPQGIIPLDDVPAHAGLIYLAGSSYSIVKDAPLLHREKVTDKIKQHIITSFAFKYWRMRLRTMGETNG